MRECVCVCVRESSIEREIGKKKKTLPKCVLLFPVRYKQRKKCYNEEKVELEGVTCERESVRATERVKRRVRVSGRERERERERRDSYQVKKGV